MQTKIEDFSRRWMWWFLAIVVASQLYFVRELLAALALFALGFTVFALGFTAIALVIAGLYMLQKGWEVAVARFAGSSYPVSKGPGVISIQASKLAAFDFATWRTYIERRHR